MEVLSMVTEELGKLSIGLIASMLSYHFGGDEYLLLLVQWLFWADFLAGVLDAKKAGLFSWARFWFGLKKVANLYFILAMIGFGTKSHDVTFTGRIDTNFDGVFFFNLALYLLIIFELSSINRHMARMDFPLNIRLQKFFTRVMFRLLGRLERRLEKKIDEVVDEFDNKL